MAIKKVVPATLYDDVLGKIPVGIITKYCRPRKLTFYPGYVESYESRMKTTGKNMEFSKVLAPLAFQITGITVNPMENKRYQKILRIPIHARINSHASPHIKKFQA